MDGSTIIDRLENAGLIRVGKPGLPAKFTRYSTRESDRVGPSIRMRLPVRHTDVHNRHDKRGSLYVHDREGIVVATGSYSEWLKSLHEPNGDMRTSKPYPAWRDYPEDDDHAVTKLIDALSRSM